MRRLLTVPILLGALLLTGCPDGIKKVENLDNLENLCPEKEVIIEVHFDGKQFWVNIPAGSLDNPDNYKTLDEFNEFFQKQMEDAKKKADEAQEEANKKKGGV